MSLIYKIRKARYPPFYHHNGFKAIQALGLLMYGYLLLVSRSQKMLQALSFVITFNWPYPVTLFHHNLPSSVKSYLRLGACHLLYTNFVLWNCNVITSQTFNGRFKGNKNIRAIWIKCSNTWEDILFEDCLGFRKSCGDVEMAFWIQF